MGPQGTSQATEPRDSTSSDDSRGLTVKDDGAAGIPAEGTASHPAVGSDDQSKSSPKFLREVLANLPPRVWPILGSSSSSTLDNNLLKINLPAVDTHVAWTHKQSRCLDGHRSPLQSHQKTRHKANWVSPWKSTAACPFNCALRVPQSRPSRKSPSVGT